MRRALHWIGVEYCQEKNTGGVPGCWQYSVPLGASWMDVFVYENLTSCILVIYTDFFWYLCARSIESFKMVEFANHFPFSNFHCWIGLWLYVHFFKWKATDLISFVLYLLWVFLKKGHISPRIFVIRWSLTLQAAYRKSCNFNMIFLWLVYFVA